MPYYRYAALFLCLLASGWLAAAQTAPPVTVDVPVLVLDHHGSPILQLDQDLFRLTDNGRPQRIVRFEREARPVSLAIVADTSDPDAIAQLKRSATLLAAMVVGDLGEASIYVSGPHPHQVLDFTQDQDKIVATLTHLDLTPVAPQGAGQITVPANQAVLALSHRPSTQARAVLIVAKNADRSGPAASALIASALENTISIFLITPELPDGAAPYVNPDSVEQRGVGPGSQRDPNVIPNGAKPGMPGAANTDTATVNLTPVLKEARHVAADLTVPHLLDYVYDTGGFTLGGGDDAEFDRNLSSIGGDLRSFYHLYYHPSDPGTPHGRHEINVTVQSPDVGRLSFRRAYLIPAGPLR